MTVKFENGSERAESELIACERSLGVRLPQDYRNFVAQKDGARPDPHFFEFGRSERCAINAFISIADIGTQRLLIEDLSPTRIPIAWAEGGNYVCLETRDAGGVYFWDHEDPGTEYRIANSFDEFLAKLQPAGDDDVVLDPAAVESAWIDPDFLERIKKT